MSWLAPWLMAVPDIGSGGTLIAVLSNHLNPACDLWPNVFRCASVSKNHVLRISDYYESLMSSRFCHLLSDIASHCLIYSANIVNIVHIVNFITIVKFDNIFNIVNIGSQEITSDIKRSLNIPSKCELPKLWRFAKMSHVKCANLSHL